MNSVATPLATAAHATAGATQSKTRGSNGKGMRYSGPKRTSRRPYNRATLSGTFSLASNASARRGHLHLFVDLRRPDIEGAAEDERKSKDVVDLVRVVATARRDDRVVS